MFAPNDLTGAIAGIEELWRETLGDPSIRIAVLDGPVDREHSVLSTGNLTALETPISGKPGNDLATEHGTYIASLIFARHSGSLAGVAPHCRGLLVPIFRCGPEGKLAACSQIDLARAILVAAQNGARVINVSGGQFTPSGDAHPVLAYAVRHCSENGILIVAAAGNDGCECLHVPAAVPSVLAVGAMGRDGRPLDSSNWGRNYQSSGILAPAEGILGAKVGGGVILGSGTSCAAALVSGVVGLLLSLQLKQGGKTDVSAVRAALLNSAITCADQPIPDCRRLLAGRLRVVKAMAIVKQGVTTVTQTIVTPDTAAEEMNGREGAMPSPTNVSFEPTPGPQVVPSGCGCGGAAPQLVFALGSLEYDFGTEARRDSITQHMEGPHPNPYDPRQLLAYLEKNPWEVASITWTVNLDATAIYAIKPSGPFAADVGQRLREFLRDRIAERVERVSIPGVISGKTALMNGQVVPVIIPDLRGMYSWTTKALVENVAGPALLDNAAKKDKDAFQAKSGRIAEFLDRVYFELRNLGITPQERAINYAATNAFNVAKVYEAALKDEMDLDAIAVERSPICRPDSDCWDVKLVFFFPERQVQTVCKVYRFTVDVSDVVPVTVGPVRSWFTR